MSTKKRLLYCLITGIVLGNIVFWTNRCNKPDVVIERDTVVVYDTVRHYLPTPKDSIVTKFVTRYLPVVRDTSRKDCSENKISVNSAKNSASLREDYVNYVSNYVTDSARDTVAVEVPIESKHYHSSEYDAWVSGFEPSLDSIFVYQKTEYITETITRTIKDSKHFFVDVGAGCEYKFNDKSAVPFAELGIKFKPGRFGIGAYGGYSHDINENKGLPYAKAKITYDIISF